MLDANQPDYIAIPQSTIDALKRYVEKGIPTGGFLYSVLTNNFIRAVGRADDSNRVVLHAIHLFVYNEMPADCWGNPEKVGVWMDKGGLEGIRKVATDGYTTSTPV